MSDAVRKFQIRNTPEQYMNKFLNEDYINQSVAAHKEEIDGILGKYGYTPKQYILDRKMQAARTMLEEDYDTIAEIADTLHFSSSQHFSASFKKSTGVSPDAYRKAFRKKQQTAAN